MNLTYEIVDSGYNILKDGKVWMVQPKGIFPHEGATVEESAQNHINAIIADNEAQPSAPTTDEQIQELMLAVAELAASSEQNKIETQLAIAELASTLAGGEA